MTNHDPQVLTDRTVSHRQYILTHVIKKMGEIGVRSATFGAGAATELHRVDNIGGFKVVTLEKAYNGISSTFHLGNKGDFRSKFGTQQDPVRRLPCHRPCPRFL